MVLPLVPVLTLPDHPDYGDNCDRSILLNPGVWCPVRLDRTFRRAEGEDWDGMDGVYVFLRFILHYKTRISVQVIVFSTVLTSF